MRVVLIEDEVPALEALERAALRCEPNLEVAARLGSVHDAVAWLSSHPAPDVLLCDIMLSDGISLSIFEQVQVLSPVIFCTAYDNYWPQALARGGIDFLVKPVEVERLRLAFSKVSGLRQHFTHDLTQMLRSWAAMPMPTRSPSKSHLVVKRGLEYVSLPVVQIAFFISEHKLVTLVDRQARHFILDRPLSEIATELPDTGFFRANRSTLVAFSAIRSFRAGAKGKIVLDIEHAAAPVVVSQENARSFRTWFER